MDRSVVRGIVLIAAVVVIVAAMFLLPGPREPEKPKHENLDPWVLVSHDPDNRYGTYLGNGFISTRIKGDGVGSQDGAPLACYMAGFYDDEKLIPIPTWSDLRLYDGENEFKIDKDEHYEQRLNMKTGILVTHATWRSGRKTVSGSIEVLVSRAQPNVGLVFALLTPNFDGKLRAGAPVGGIVENLKPAVPNAKSAWESRELSGGRQVLTGSFVTSQSKIPLGMALCVFGDGRNSPKISTKEPAASTEISVTRDGKFMIFSYAAFSTGHDPASARDFAVSEIETAIAQKMDFVRQHKAAWEKLWEKDIVIDGPKKDQQALHSCMFYLLCSVREGSQWSIPPMGLSDAAFSGHVFWDADLWMFPALILQHPQLARSIVDYRYNTLPGAIANAKLERYPGAQYAWESGYTGKEDTPEGLAYRHERHINGDIALSQWQYYLATGDLNWLKARGFPVIKATADYWVGRCTFVKEKDRYEILRVVPPDENAEIIDNSAYTNCIARLNLEIASAAAKLVGERPDPQWATVASKIYIPVDSAKKRFIAFDQYRGFDAKQADCELIIYPLQFRIPGQDMTEIYKNTFDFYAPKAMEKGPAMTSSAHSVIAARFKDADKAYAEFVDSYKPFLRGPMNYFNEKPSESYENMCFLTGAAGPIQAALFGLAGISMDYFPADASKVDLKFDPCLPKQWKSLRIMGVQWRGKIFDVVVDSGNEVELRNVRSL